MKRFLCVLAGALMFLIASPRVFSSEVDILVQKLVEKGILTQREADTVLSETREKFKAEIPEKRKAYLPQWLQDIRLKGDFRLRHQWNDINNDSVSGRHRGRIRFRLGLETQFLDDFNLYAGLITGSADPRSGNQTFQDGFTTKGINLDYAYLKYTPVKWLSLYAGKIERGPVLWEPTSGFLWSNDIRPEGFGFSASTKIDNWDLSFTGGIFHLHESGSLSSEPVMAHFQPGFRWKINDWLNLRGAVTSYIIDTKEKTLGGTGNSFSSRTNTRMPGASAYYAHDYNAVVPALQMDISKPLGGVVPWASISGEYVNAYNNPSDNNGWAVGLRFGDSRVNDKHKWQMSYLYRHLERDAWADFLPDGSYGGDTNIKGHQIGLTYGVSKNVNLGFNCYLLEPVKAFSGIGGNFHPYSDSKLTMFQTDVVFRF